MKTMIIRIVLLSCVLIFNEAAYEGESCTAGEVAGICTLLPKCQSAIDGLKNKEGPKLCGFVKETPVVCCTEAVNTTNEPNLLLPITTQRPPSTTLYVPDVAMYDDVAPPAEGCRPLQESITSAKTGQKAFDKCIDYQEKYVFPCMKPDQTRPNYCHQDPNFIFEPEVIMGDLSHEVMLGYTKDSEESVSWHCGGSVISEKYVLTAAHCIPTRQEEDKYRLLGVLTNSHATNYSNFYEIKRYILHPEYQPPSKYNDIALLETEKEIILGHLSVVPACLHVGDPINDERAIVTRRGQDGSLEEVTQAVKLQKFSAEECSTQYPVHRLLKKSFDPQTQLCYGDRNQATTTCQGYSGGSIQVKNNRIYCMYTIIGVSSFGKGCKYPVPPTVYTKVSHYIPWIENIVWP